MRQAVILAGGGGTRLRSRLGDLPKPLVDVCGLPLLERQVLLAKRHGFTRLLLLVHHGAAHIVEYCRAKRDWGLDIACVDDGRPRGTAGAVLAAYDRLDEEFLVIYGDTMLDVDLSRLRAFHSTGERAAATLFLHPNDHPHDSDLVEVDDNGRITGFLPYPHDGNRYYPNLVNAALYCVRRDALAPWREEAGSMDFGKDLFPAMLRRGMLLRGYRSPEYIKDIGTPERLDRACADFRSGRIARASLLQPQPMVFLDRDGTINRDVERVRRAEDFELLHGAASAIKRLNGSDYRVCVVTNQPVVARGDCSFEVLRDIHNKMETLLGAQGAYVDRIYCCPHHPHGGFPGERPELKIDCACRKPNTGMIEQAVRDFNADLGHSWLVGDSSVDIETARRAGIRSILVETGQAGLDYRSWALPDATVPNLEHAVAFILDGYPRLLARCDEMAGDIGAGALDLVGGQARSGKSTFAAALRDALRAGGKRALVVSADRWLRNEPERGPGVLDRYDMPALQALVDRLALGDRRPDKLVLPAYHRLQRRTVDAVETLAVLPTDVVVLEGTVALGLATPPEAEAHRFFVEIDEQQRQDRVVREYRLRGLTEGQAAQVYLTRFREEVPVLEGFARGARRVPSWSSLL